MSKVTMSRNPASARPGERPHHPARRARKHGVDRLLARPRDRQRAPVRPHDADRARARLLLQPPQVARHHRRDVGVHRGGRCAFELAVFGQDLRRHRHQATCRPQPFRHGGLVRGVGVGVQQRHRPRLRLTTRQRLDLRRIERLDLLSLRPQPPADAHPVGARHQRRRPVAGEGVELRAVLAPDLDHVLEAPVGHQHDARALALEQGVGPDGRAVHHEEGSVFVHQLPHPFQHRLRRVRRG